MGLVYSEKHVKANSVLLVVIMILSSIVIFSIVSQPLMKHGQINQKHIQNERD